MVIDSSAFVAIVMDEGERSLFNRLIANAPVRLVSAGTLLETYIVLESRFSTGAVARLDEYIQRAEIQTRPVDHDQIMVARQAFRRFGKGRHRASLNFGDCFAYALAHLTCEPLLFKGTDFQLTDITPAV